MSDANPSERSGERADPDRVTRVVLLARPGAGKSTQAERLSARLEVAHLATGALLRREVASASRLGLAVKQYLDRGDLVPDGLVADVIRPELEGAVESGYVLDGFPRDMAQLDALARMEAEGILGPQVAVSLDVSAEECRERLLARAKIEGRSDDDPETVDRRLASYERATAPILGEYARRGLLVRVDGEAPPDVVTVRIVDALRPR